MEETATALTRRTVLEVATALALLPTRALAQADASERKEPKMAKPSATVLNLVEEAKAGNTAWVNGQPDYAEMMSHTPDFTISGPFGGPTWVGWSEDFRIRQAQGAAQFKGGTTDIDLINSHESGDLIVLITREHGEVEFDGFGEPQPWNLRVTQVYRRESGEWKVIHRHAEPLVEPRTLEESIALVSKREKY